MILRTYRDVEIELRKLQAAINDIPKIKESSGLNTAQVIALINSYAKNTTVVNTVETAPPDLDSSNAGTLIIHKLVHQFLEKVIFDGLVAIAGDLSVNGNLTVVNDLTVNGDAIILGELGAAIQRVLKIWTQELSVLPGLVPAVVGQVLTAANVDGTVEWQTPSTGSSVGSITEYLSAGSFVFTTAWSPIPGLNSISLPAIGTYMVTVNYTANWVVNDLAIAVTIQTIGSATATTGSAHFSKVAADAFEVSGARSWKVDVTGLGAIIAVNGIKSGTGASFIYSGATCQVLRVT